MLHLALDRPVRRLGLVLHRPHKHPSTPELRRQAITDLGRQQLALGLLVLSIPGYESLLILLPLLPLEGSHSIELLLPLALVELAEVLLEVEAGVAFAAADAADVGLGREEEALALEDVGAAALSAVVEDPAGEVGEGVAVGVGGHVDEAAEALGDVAEGNGGVVGGAAGGLVVEVPEEDHLLLLGCEDPISILHHLHLCCCS